MKVSAMCLALVCSYTLLSTKERLVEAAPWRTFEDEQNQACGDKLADIMSLVCSGRGYNDAFRPERQTPSARRFRRGIVEECCRRSCSPAMLELYCKAAPSTEKPTVQIRKRSDSGGDSQEYSSTKTHQRIDKVKPQHRRILVKDTTTTMKGKNNLVDLLMPSSGSTGKEIYEGSIPLLRHHRSHHHHHHHSSKQFRGRKAFAKTKREKKANDEAKETFRIGTVKPYFTGKAFASYHSIYAHHHQSPLS